MVMDFGTMRVLGDLTGSISEDIWNVVYEASEGNKKERIVKVIFENSELNSDPNLIKEACEACTEAGAHFVKTSTGFGKYGARAKDLKIMRDNFAGGVKMAGRVNPKNLRKLLRAASGRNDGYIELDPMKIRIGESSLLDKLDNMGVGEVGGEGKY
jgi:deoxyribose-phosphate aldolase